VEIKPSSGSGLDKFDVAYFTASCDTPATNKKYAEALKLDYPILSDPRKKVAEAYGVVHEGRAVPERWTFFIGTDGKILHVDKKISTKTHGIDVSKRLTELRVPKK
jgi:peroxiredoxin Q/BCP